MSNALKFTEKGDIELTAAFHPVESDDNEGGGNLELSVKDAGCGIPKDKLEAVFEPFHRLTPSFQDTNGGSGLGLYMVKKMIERMQGHVSVSSEVDKGSTFFVTIPVTVQESEHKNLDALEGAELFKGKKPSSTTEKERVSPTKAPAVQGERDSSYRVLVVEDDRIAQAIACAQLKPLQCRVDVVGTAENAIEHAKMHRYDMIFMDIGLPDQNGKLATQHIRQDNDALSQHAPIVALTAHIDTDEKKECLETGMNLVVHKPLTENLARTILGLFLA